MTEEKPAESLKVSKEGNKFSLAGNGMAVVAALTLALLAYQTDRFLSRQESQEVTMEKHLERLEKAQDEINGIRLDQCHMIQTASIQTLDKVADVLDRYREAKETQQQILHGIADTMESVESTMREQTTQFRILTDRLLDKKATN